MREFTLLLFITALILGGCSDNENRSRAEENAASSMKKAKILVDDAAILGDDEKFMKAFRDYNEELLRRFDIDFRVVTTMSDEDIDIQANRLFNTLQKESRSHSGKALLLLINPIQDKVRLEVSQALEPIYTDAMVSYLERKGMVPYFRDDKVADGAFMAMELIHDRANDAAKGKEFVPPMNSRSIGGGARTEAKIAQKDSKAKRGVQIVAVTGELPEQIMKKYLKALKSHNTNPDLEIYSRATRKFFRQHTVTKINQNNEVRFLSPCLSLHEVHLTQDGNHAVSLVPPLDEHRTCSPYFFVKEEGKWRLDIASMAQMIRFNADMMWHFDPAQRLKNDGIYYATAFDGYSFDVNGYPHRPAKGERKPDDVRWGYQCGTWFFPRDKDNVKREPKKYYRCGITKVWRGSPAEVRLGLRPGDYIYGVGNGSDYIDLATYAQFMDYMKRVPPGEIATVTVRVNQREKAVRRGLAP